MLRFGMVEAVLRTNMSKLGASSDSCEDIVKRSLEVVMRLCLRKEFKAKSAKTFEIQTQAGCSKFKIYALEHSKTRGSKREALLCMF